MLPAAAAAAETEIGSGRAEAADSLRAWRTRTGNGNPMEQEDDARRPHRGPIHTEKRAGARPLLDGDDIRRMLVASSSPDPKQVLMILQS